MFGRMSRAEILTSIYSKRDAVIFVAAASSVVRLEALRKLKQSYTVVHKQFEKSIHSYNFMLGSCDVGF